MSVFSKFFTSIFCLVSLLLPFVLCLFSLFIILVLLYKISIISAFSLAFISFLSSHILLSIFLLYLGIALGFFFPDVSKYLRIIIYVSIIYLTFSLFVTEISIISSIGLKINQNTCASAVNFIQSLVCTVFGFFPRTDSLNEVLVGLSIFIFGILLPLIIIYKLISNAIKDSGMITNDNYRFFISISLAFFAFRGLVLSKLLNALSIGLGGLIIVVINFIVLKHVIGKVHKISLKFSRMEQKELKERYSERLKGILKLKLSEIKSLQSSHQMKTALDDIKLDLESYFSSINKPQVFHSLLNEFILHSSRGDINGMRNVIDKMIAEIE